MKIIARFFALYREKTGLSSVVVELPDGSTANDLMDHLHLEYESLPKWDGIMIAINSEYSDFKTLLYDNDEVAFIPPVSGGQE